MHPKKTEALAKSMNINMWLVGTSNQLFITGSHKETKFSKKQSSYWQNIVIVPFCTPHTVFL